VTGRTGDTEGDDVIDPALLVFIGLVVAAAATGVVFRPGPWYETLRKPPWTPPNATFGPVWTILYVMIAIAGWLVWKSEGSGFALLLWALQLVLNGLWSYLFFGIRRMDLALVDAVLMWFAVAAFVLAALPVSLAASLLFIPYLAWVTVAAALNRAVLRLNREQVSPMGSG
jgi:tryptophan-rich sensory protein